MRIDNVGLNFDIEPLRSAFGFKGGFLSELWQPIAKVENQSNVAVGVGVQSVLWSDSEIFRNAGQCAGNLYMMLGCEYGLKLLKGSDFESPAEALLAIEDDVYAYLKKVTGYENLRKTFALNSLVALDNALWQLYAKENGTEDILKLVDDETRNNLSSRYEKIYNIPLIGYGTSIEEIKRLISEGYFLLKIKIGSDPDKDGSRDKMLEWDKNRLLEIHNIAKEYTTPYTDSGKILYYLDANSRYDTKDRLFRLLDYADKIGALDSIVIFEEPFEENMVVDLSDIPVRVTADESAHSLESALERIRMGYTAIAIKPIAKTVSESLQIINVAAKYNIPCFCADLTVNPYMVEINKNIAARIKPFPGVKIAVFETNGAQNYVNWEKMKSYHPMYGKAKFLNSDGCISELDDEFYRVSGGFFRTSEYYESRV